VPPGWVRVGEFDGVPLWRWREGGFHAVTSDMDQLLFIGAALVRFDEMDAKQFRASVTPLVTRPKGRSWTVRALRRFRGGSA
jgi:DNA/RNA-binding domain of Phe-tRNA-synthetase-like protein